MIFDETNENIEGEDIKALLEVKEKLDFELKEKNDALIKALEELKKEKEACLLLQEEKELLDSKYIFFESFGMTFYFEVNC